MTHGEMEALPELPDDGFYYHYKHDPNGAVNNYAYYIFNVGHHTEDDCRPIDKFTANYLPLYEDAYVYRLGNGRISDTRPLSMLMSKVTKDGVELNRFTRIFDPDIIDALTIQGRKMYPNRPFFR